MDRPFDIDMDDVFHRRAEAEVQGCDYVSNGDSTRRGVYEGIAEHPFALCPDCIAPDSRSGLWNRAAEYLGL